MPVFPDTRALLEACRRNEGGAWEEFLRLYSRLIYWSIGETLSQSRYHARREELAADIFQDVFSKLFGKNELLNLTDAIHIKKFLVVLSGNLTMDRLRSIACMEEKSIVLEEADDPALAEVPDPSQISQKNECYAVIEQALQGLNARERAYVELGMMDGKTHREIGEIFGVSPDTISSIIKRAKEKIRIKLVRKGFLK